MTARGVDDAAIYLCDGDRRLFLGLLAEVVLRFDWLCHAVDSDEHLEAACRYVLANPVRAGLCAEPSAWPWSGSRYGTEVF